MGISKHEKKKRKKKSMEMKLAIRPLVIHHQKNKKRKKRNRKNSNRTMDNPPSEKEESLQANKTNENGVEDKKQIDESLPNRQREKRSKRLKAIDKRGGSLLSRRERKKIKASSTITKDISQNRGANTNVNFDDLVSKYKKRLEKSNILGQGSSSDATAPKKITLV